ncbi:Metal-binding activator 1 [Wickerhamomyces ciferrii]|uniref:Metal-binding activator 1 n=1 Tax=Wickerhamomyces ciferrii (strain ATCC 14091 / BCRC 22168 / CBS 111 / JCM 3599 / NBRC 0793 / NRRL Y-1031 F-60-10) TaxID=1206466 RepID=K0KLK6_WICCF|nr:Metal-binding activator 1 [Wickerhamomyces ciferrii]CCH42234.1 Metal-binding activator 1 [Wickerhamomyces ciferrii]
MILVDGEKYACVQCIRGHRSSTCKHSQRALVQVRSRGRPSLNAGHRIAVTESQLVLSRDEVTIQDSNGNIQNGGAKQKLKEKSKSPQPESLPVKSCCSSKVKSPEPQPSTKEKEDEEVPVPKSSCCSSKPKSQESLNLPPVSSSSSSLSSTVDKPTDSSSCSSATHANCNCGKNGVIMLKASRRQFVDVRNGAIDYVGPYNESSLSKFKIASLQKSFNRHKHSKNSSCCSSKSGNSNSIRNKLKLLKTIKMNETDYQIPRDQLNGLNFPLAPANIAPRHDQLQDQQQQQHSYQYYQRQPNDTGQSISSTTYQKDLSALGLPIELPQAEQIHPQDSQQFDQALIEYQQLQLQQQQQHNQTHTQQPSNQSEPKYYDVVLSSGCATECGCGPDCECPGCLIHRTNEELKEYGILDTSPASTPTPEPQQLPSLDNGLFSMNPNTNGNFKLEPSNYDLINLETIDELLQNNYMFDDECYCEALECSCYNCPKHGIVDGIRTSDGKRVAFGDDRTPDNVSSIGSETSVANQ